MADNYIVTPRYIGAGTSTLGEYHIGQPFAGQVKMLRHETDITDGDIKSMHLYDDSTSYQNTSGATAYFTLAIVISSATGDRIIKIHSSPNDDSLTGATLLETLDSSSISEWDAVNDVVSTAILGVENNHYIIVENATGVSGRNVEVQLNKSSVVVEQQ